MSSKTQRSSNRAAQVPRIAAMGNCRSDNALAAYYRRLALRIGTPKAITAAARKLAVIIYSMLKNGQPCREQATPNYTRQQRKRRLARLKKNKQDNSATPSLRSPQMRSPSRQFLRSPSAPLRTAYRRSEARARGREFLERTTGRRNRGPRLVHQDTTESPRVDSRPRPGRATGDRGWFTRTPPSLHV